MSVKELPSLTGLSEQQIRGKACVWCAIALENGTAVDLGRRPIQYAGTQTSWFPRGCPSCAESEALKDLAEHTERCRACNTRGGLCSTRTGMQKILKQARR